jgi:hypothetical protein
MTYCSTLAKPLKKRIDAGETLDEIATSLCGNTVKRPRQKVIRIIIMLLGTEYLLEHSDTLGYDVKKVELGKKPKSSLRKIKTDADGDYKDSKLTEPKKSDKKAMSLDEIVSALEELITQTTPTTFISALEVLLDKHKDLIE